MKLVNRIELSQRQELNMTQELRQSIEILQLNSLDMKDYLEKEVMENPLLELKDSKEEINWENYIKKDRFTSKGVNNYTSEYNDEYNPEEFVIYNLTLEEHLIEQLQLMDINKSNLFICKILVGEIDSSGYLDIDFEDIKKSLKITDKKLEECINIIKSLDPVGVGARDLKECLLIQLKDKNIKDEKIYLIVEKYLEDLAKNRIIHIAKQLNITVEDVKKAVKVISSLDPTPGRKYSNSNEDIKYITPDAFIKEVEGKLIVIVDDECTNGLHINNQYKNILLSTKDESTKKYLTNKLDGALWIIRSIEQRRQTIKKVIESIIKFQSDFFYTDNEKINPLTLKEVADDIKMHESTVSRVTSNKYVDTPKGLFELKYFFNSEIKGIEENVSSLDIKNEIKELVDNENKKKPYSDKKIADLLAKKGIDISRRTIAKYREELNIFSSYLRKEH